MMHPSQQENQKNNQCELGLQFYLVILAQPPARKYQLDETYPP